MNRVSDISEQYIDYIPDEQYVLLWTFSPQYHAPYTASYDTETLYRALVHGLTAVSRSPHERIRKRFFFIWGGEYQDHFLLAVSARLTMAVKDLITLSLAGMSGYGGMEYGMIPLIPLLPVFAYDRGIIVRYGTPEQAGANSVVDAKGPGKGVLLQYRVWFPRSSFHGDYILQ
ncbi:MAG: hypothetical protein JXA20_00255 [Spirochaetes bacterium]|nr:hypothetical protein [Spirochaetota bacterium]